MKKALFIDRDGTLIIEPPVTFQVNSLEEMVFLPNVIGALRNIRQKLDFEFVMVTNQDGLGTEANPQDMFDTIQNKMLDIFKGEGVEFDAIHIDDSFEGNPKPTRKPNTGMLTGYMTGEYDLASCFVIGDRKTDVILAKNLGCKAIFMNESIVLEDELAPYCVLQSVNWLRIMDFLVGGERKASVKRTTKETDIDIYIDLDGNGRCEISTGVKFFDHMLEQIGKHSGCDLRINVIGDLEVDEHHTIEDTAIALGEALHLALGSKRGIERYGYVLPMDECLAQVALDFGGRSWLVFDAEFRREKIGDFPTEMIYHFFKSFSDAAKMNLNISATGDNEHHKLEGIFKALARAIKMAIKRDVHNMVLPSTKGVL